jgi:XRE family transcriptional regulator, regulator of sulfur utilization
MKNSFIVTIGKGIRKERERNGMTQADLAEYANIHPNYIGQIERGEKNVTIIVLNNICHGLGIGLSDFLLQLNL